MLLTEPVTKFARRQRHWELNLRTAASGLKIAAVVDSGATRGCGLGFAAGARRLAASTAKQVSIGGPSATSTSFFHVSIIERTYYYPKPNIQPRKRPEHIHVTLQVLALQLHHHQNYQCRHDPGISGMSKRRLLIFLTRLRRLKALEPSPRSCRLLPISSLSVSD